MTVKAKNGASLSDVQFEYTDVSAGTTSGPLSLADTSVSATDSNGNSLQSGDSFSDYATYVFDSGTTAFDYTSDRFTVSASAYGTTYDQADSDNRSALTANWHRVSIEDASGKAVTGVPLLHYHPDTNESLGFHIPGPQSSTVVYNCRGVENQGSCTNPDTGSAGQLEIGSGLSGPVRTFQSPVAVQAYALSEANVSKKVAPGAGTTTLTAEHPGAPTFMFWQSASSGGSTPQVESVTVTDTTTDTVVWKQSGAGQETAPVVLRPNRRYEVTLKDPDGFGTVTRSLARATKGTFGASLRVDTTGLDHSTVTGQVVNESGDPVSDAVVIAQPEYAGAGQIDVYNSTTTDANGVFSMALPQTDQLQNGYSFAIVGTETKDGTAVYYPTTDANGGDGYAATGDETVLPPLTLQSGGRVRVDVTSSQQSLPVSRAITSLSQLSSAYPGDERTANAFSFATFAFGKNTPASATVALMSPTTGGLTQATYNLWGQKQGQTTHLCAGSPSVSAGQTTTSDCTLEQAGYLNLTVDQYESAIAQSTKTTEQPQPGEFGFLFENELLVRDATSGDVVTYLGPEGVQQSFVDRGTDTSNVSVPLPPGDYTVELRPAFESAPWTSVERTTSVSITAGSTTSVTLNRGERFAVEPVPGQYPSSLTRNADNNISVLVGDPGTETLLTGSDATVTAQLLNPDGTTASEPVALSHVTVDGQDRFRTTTFNPSSLGVDAGRYQLAIRVSHASGDETYNATWTDTTSVAGLSTGVELNSRSVAPGANVSGQIHAYDTTKSTNQGVTAAASNVELLVYDQNGRQVASTTPANGVVDGEGTFELAMPSEPGRYRISTRVTANSGKQGIAEQWLRVSEYDLDVETDRRTYGPTDTVRVNVEVSTADGSAVTDGQLDIRINGQEKTVPVGNNGTTTVKLDPGTYGEGSGQWIEGNGIGVTFTRATDSGVDQKTAGTGFEVRSFTARAEPTSGSFAPTEPATVDVSVPTDITVADVTVTDLDGETASAESVSTPAEGVRRVDLGTQPVGEHLVTMTVTSENSGTQTVRTGFRVEEFGVSASLDKRSYGTDEDVTVDVTVRKPDGTAVGNQAVSAQLNTTSPVRAVDSASGTTNADGETTLTLSPENGGFHFVRVDVGQQRRYLGLIVNDVDLTLTDGSGTAVSGYTTDVGTTGTVHVSATNAGSPVPEDSQVAAFVPTLDRTVELGTATTDADGNASISYTVPDSVPARDYDLVVAVRTPDGGTGSTAGTLTVSGSQALEITADTNRSAYSPDSGARLSAVVTTGDGSPVADKQVDFVLESDGSADQRVATTKTNADGVATYDYTIPASTSDGEYALRTELNDSSSIRDYSGYQVRSLEVSVEAADGPYNPGDSVPLTVRAVDDAGNPVDADSGKLRLVLPSGSTEQSLSVAGNAPYNVSVDLPDDSAVTGTRSISVGLQNGRATDTDSTLVEVRDSSENASFSVAEPVVAGQSATVTVTGTVDTTAVLTAYSPDANQVAYNDSVQVSSSSETTTDMTIDSPGTYVVRLSVPGVGSVTKVVDVEPAIGEPSVWTGTGVDANATTVGPSEDLYIKTNQPGMTATVISEGTTYEVALDQQAADGTYYGVLRTDRSTGVYLVRLDSERATSVDDTIVEVAK